MYGPITKLKNNPLTKLYGPILLGEIVQNNQKTVCYASFFPFGGHLGNLDPKQFPKVLKWIRHMCQCLDLKISP
jgi:hypothetical protein